jgi:hypothetical protein
MLNAFFAIVDNEKVIETKGTVGAVVLDLHGRVACT